MEKRRRQHLFELAIKFLKESGVATRRLYLAAEAVDALKGVGVRPVSDLEKELHAILGAPEPAR